MSKWRTLGAVARWVYAKPPAVVIAAAALVAALAAGQPVVLLIGAVAEVVLLFAYLQSPQAIRQALREQRKRELDRRIESLEEEIEQLDTESRLRMRNILDLNRQLHAETDDPEVQEYTASTLLASTVQIGELTDRALRLARKKRDLQRYLNRTDEEQLEQYMRQIRARIESAGDAIERGQYEQSLRLKTRELEDHRAIAATARRIDGQLENVESAFAGLRARLVRLKAADVTQWTAAGEQLRGELESLSVAVETLEQSVNEALSI